MGLKYIYTGYCKTGTKTIQEAFKILGYKVYDWEENAMYCADAWIQVFSKTTSSQEKEKLISEMYKDVDVVVEGPNIFYWREILKIFPDCKVIHYQRDEDDWWNSFSKQLNMYNEFNPGVPNWFIYITLIFIPTLGKQSYLYKNHLASLLINQKGNTFIPPWTMELKNVNEFMARRAYRTHNSDVLQGVLASAVTEVSI